MQNSTDEQGAAGAIFDRYTQFNLLGACSLEKFNNVANNHGIT